MSFALPFFLVSDTQRYIFWALRFDESRVLSPNVGITSADLPSAVFFPIVGAPHPNSMVFSPARDQFFFNFLSLFDLLQTALLGGFVTFSLFAQKPTLIVSPRGFVLFEKFGSQFLVNDPVFSSGFLTSPFLYFSWRKIRGFGGLPFRGFSFCSQATAPNHCCLHPSTDSFPPVSR